MVDYPDDYPPVFSTPPRPVVDQVPTFSYTLGVLAAGANVFIQYTIPNDGNYYLVDTAFCNYDAIGPIQCWLSLALNVATGAFFPIVEAQEHNLCDLYPHRHGGLYLTYPNALKLYISNTNSVVRSGIFIIELIKYPKA
jgi:hypothetical protein